MNGTRTTTGAVQPDRHCQLTPMTPALRVGVGRWWGLRRGLQSPSQLSPAACAAQFPDPVGLRRTPARRDPGLRQVECGARDQCFEFLGMHVETAVLPIGAQSSTADPAPDRLRITSTADGCVSNRDHPQMLHLCGAMMCFRWTTGRAPSRFCRSDGSVPVGA